MNRLIPYISGISLCCFLIMPNSAHADFIAVGDHLEEAGNLLGSFEIDLNGNYGNYETAFGEIESQLDMFVFAGGLNFYSDLGESLFLAAAHFRDSDLSAAADELEATGTTLNQFSSHLNADMAILENAFDDVYTEMSLVGPVTAPHVFSGLGTGLISAADHLRNAVAVMGDPLLYDVYNAELNGAANAFNAAGNTWTVFISQLNANFGVFDTAFFNVYDGFEGGSPPVSNEFFNDFSFGLEEAADDLVTVPEPSAFILLGSLVCAFVAFRWRKRCHPATR